MHVKKLMPGLIMILMLLLTFNSGCVPQDLPGDLSGDQVSQTADQSNGRAKDEEKDDENGGMIVSAEGQSSDNGQVLWSEPEELSLEEYAETYGRDLLEADPITTVAQQVGSIAINSTVLSGTEFKIGDRIQLPLFDGEKRSVEIEKILFTADTTSFMGSTMDPFPGRLYLSFTGDQVLAHLRLEAENRLYLVKFNVISGKHYLFQAPLDQIEVPQEDTPLGMEDFFNIER